MTVVQKKRKEKIIYNVKIIEIRFFTFLNYFFSTQKTFFHVWEGS